MYVQAFTCKCIEVYAHTELKSSYRPTERRRKWRRTRHQETERERSRTDAWVTWIDVHKELTTDTRATRHKHNGNAKVWARMNGVSGVHFGGGGGLQVNIKWETSTAQSRANNLTITTSIAKTAGCKTLSDSENNSWLHSRQITCQFQYTSKYTTVI